MHSLPQDLRFMRRAAGCLLALIAISAQGQKPTPILSWQFDEKTGERVSESRQTADGKLSGVYLRVPGVSGQAVRLDGESSGIVVPGAAIRMPESAFTVDAWVAIDAYPWNWAPILDQRRGESAGFLFGVDSFGHLGLQAEVGGAWQYLVSEEQLPLKKWSHVAASFSEVQGMRLFIDGKTVRQRKTAGGFVAALGEDLLIGRVRYAMLPAQWIHPKFAIRYSFDGILDDLKVFDRALSDADIRSEFESIQAPKGDVLPYPKLPSGPPNSGPFGAFYATLKYDEIWDMPRRVAPDSDVVVRFDQSPIRLISWQGNNYIPAWVTENGKWYTDEFVESGGTGCPLGGDCEPMSDKQNRYAHVRILESTPARVVIHFRYAQCEVEQYVCANPDPDTGWTDVADDYYTVYPDGVAARNTVAWSSNLSYKIPEFQETIIINPPGTRPEQNIETNALTFVNMKGETYTYSWDHPPAIISKPAGANIQMVNLKSHWKPFQIVFSDRPLISTYLGEKTYSMFEWWNHWPVAQVKSSGISAVAPDRPSSSSLSHIEGQPYRRTPQSVTKIMLAGLTDRQAADLVPLAKSWIAPPEIHVEGPGFESKGYDPAQRAFLISRDGPQAANSVMIRIAASPDSPLVNPCFVIKSWGSRNPTITLNGKVQEPGPGVRFGIVDTLDGENLVVWLEMKATQPASLELAGTKD